MLASLAFTSFLTGITEPIEFMFIFFLFVIKKFDIPTSGREKDEEFDENVVVSTDSSEVSKSYIDALGGTSNLKTVDNCATRLRLEVLDGTKVNDKILKALGARGVVRLSKTSVQVIVDTNVQFVADGIKTELSILK